MASMPLSQCIWLVSLMSYDQAFLDLKQKILEQKALQPLDNPFGARRHPCLRNELSPKCPVRTFEDWYSRVDSNRQPPDPQSEECARASCCAVALSLNNRA